MVYSSLTSVSLKALNCFLDERIRVVKEEAGTSTFNRSYGKFQANQDKAQKSKLL